MSLEKPIQDPHDIIENAPIGIYTTTPQGRYIFANPALAGIYGYTNPLCACFFNFFGRFFSIMIFYPHHSEVYGR